MGFWLDDINGFSDLKFCVVSYGERLEQTSLGKWQVRAPAASCVAGTTEPSNP